MVWTRTQRIPPLAQAADVKAPASMGEYSLHGKMRGQSRLGRAPPPKKAQTLVLVLVLMFQAPVQALLPQVMAPALVP